MFANSTILITGATSGIGLSLALALQQKGNRVIVAGRRQALLDQIAQDNPGLTAYRLDLADAHDISRFAAVVARENPGLNVVIHNAGIMVAEQLSAAPTDLAIAEQTIATNLLGPIRLTHALLPLLAGKPGSAIVTVSSGLAFVPLAMTPTYSATKAALHSWTQSLRHQLQGTGTRVIEIAPPAVQTNLMPGQATAAHAMPLAAFVDEVMALIAAEVPDEVLVERVRPLRHAEAEGQFGKVFQAINGMRR